jgi:hypothetical protein
MGVRKGINYPWIGKEFKVQFFDLCGHLRFSPKTLKKKLEKITCTPNAKAGREGMTIRMVTDGAKRMFEKDQRERENEAFRHRYLTTE